MSMYDEASVLLKFSNTRKRNIKHFIQEAEYTIKDREEATQEVDDGYPIDERNRILDDIAQYAIPDVFNVNQKKWCVIIDDTNGEIVPWKTFYAALLEHMKVYY